MKKELIILLFILNCFLGKEIALAQGFDWQYSPRLPFAQPREFVGVYASIGRLMNTGSFSFLEDHIPCCDYSSGFGESYRFGFTGEYWQSGVFAMNSGIGLIVNNSNFSTLISVPRSDGKIDYFSSYKYFLDESRTYLSFDFGGRYRISESHFSFGGNLNLQYKIKSTAVHKERIESPASEKFIDGSTERIITNGIIGKYNNILIIPDLSFNYDFSIMRGYYSTICLYAAFPLTSVVQEYNWREWKTGLNIRFYKSFDF